VSEEGTKNNPRVLFIVRTPLRFSDNLNTKIFPEFQDHFEGYKERGIKRKNNGIHGNPG
jgi:hypothetical protein